MFPVIHRLSHVAVRAWFALFLLTGGQLDVAAVGQEQQDARVLAEFDIARGGDDIMLPVAVSGKTYSFCLDTGSSHCAYDASLRPLLGKPVRTVKAALVNGVESVEVYKAPAASVGGLPLGGAREVGCLAMPAFSSDGDKRQFQGILGMDVLADKIIEIDFDRGKLRFVSSAAKERAVAIPLKWRRLRTRRVPFVTLTLGGAAGRSFELAVDTGAGGSHTGWISTEAFDELLGTGAIRVLSSRAPLTGLTGHVAHGRRGRVDSISLGPFTHENAVLFESWTPAIGLAYLSRFKVTFDFPASVMYLEKGEQYERRDMYNLSGLHIVKRDEEFVVTRVEASSIADAAGVRPNDVILQVDDTLAAGASTKGLRRLFCILGERRLRIDREGREQSITLRLED